MVFCIHGFPTQVAALQFEWAWQHPRESLAVREAASTFKTLGGLANKIKLALTMITLPSWKSMDLTVSFFSTKYMNHTAGCPSLPRQMKLHFCSMDELPCYWRGDHPDGYDDEYDTDSNRNEDSDHLVDDRQVSSIDTERFTVQSANESIWTWDQRDLDNPLERESCPMVGNDTVEEDKQILQSPPTNVHTENKTKEISTQELIESLHGIDPSDKESSSHSFHQIDPSEKASASYPVLEEDMDLSRQFPASGLSKEMWTEEQRDSSPLLEDLTEPFGQVERSEGESSSMVIEMLAKKDDMTYVLIDESTNEQRYPTYEQLPVRRVRGDAVWPSSMEGIEVIDLFTPSPECRVVSGSKKRRVTRDSTDIIDLTRSPLFVQL